MRNILPFRLHSKYMKQHMKYMHDMLHIVIMKIKNYLPPTYVEWTMPAFTAQPQSVTALWPVLISRPAEGRRLSWPGSLVTYWGGLPELVNGNSFSVSVRLVTVLVCYQNLHESAALCLLFWLTQQYKFMKTSSRARTANFSCLHCERSF